MLRSLKDAKNLRGGGEKKLGERVRLWVQRQRDTGQIGKWVILTIYVVFNLVYGFYLVGVWTGIVETMQKKQDSCAQTDAAAGDATVGAHEAKCSLVSSYHALSSLLLRSSMCSMMLVLLLVLLLLLLSLFLFHALNPIDRYTSLLLLLLLSSLCLL